MMCTSPIAGLPLSCYYVPSFVTPSEEQLDQLGQLILRSQRNFKELIDSLDDVALAISLDGTLKTVNRRMTELLGVPYTGLVNHKLEIALHSRTLVDYRAIATHTHSESGIERPTCGVSQIDLQFP